MFKRSDLCIKTCSQNFSKDTLKDVLFFTSEGTFTVFIYYNYFTFALLGQIQNLDIMFLFFLPKKMLFLAKKLCCNVNNLHLIS